MKVNKMSQKTIKKGDASTMKNVFFAVMVAVLAIGMAYGTADAAVSGQCANCHTMHNSQNGAAVTTGSTSVLLKGGCIACHAAGTSSLTTLRVDETNPGTQAGGSFKQTGSTGSSRHDVATLTTDGTLTVVPGKTGAPIQLNVGELTCAGVKGCHGKHDATNGADELGSIKGAHHDKTGTVLGFRMLWYGTDAATATQIAGKGSADFEKASAGAGNHNVYAADNGTTRVGISSFCANCHGAFHGTGNTNPSSPFQRHPTDNLLSAASGWTMASVTVDYVNNPFSFESVSGMATTAAYTTTNAKVSCISCHRAHGTQYADLLRFDYSAQSAGGGGTTGCLGCHHKQR